MSGWKTVRISDFCRTGTGGTPSRSNLERYYEGGTIPWVKSGELRETVINETEEHVTEAALQETNVKLVPAGALLLAMYGATVGRLGILGVDATTNQAVCHIIPDPKVAEVRFLFYALCNQVSNLIARGVGGAQPNISQGIIKDLVLALPPLTEQRRIAEVLDRAEALRAKRRAALAQLDSLSQSLFLDLFGDPATNSKGFPKKALNSLVRGDDTINYGVVQPGNDLDEGVPLVRVGDLIDGKVKHADLKRIAPSIEATYKRSRLRGDEILVSCVGSIGVVALADESVKGFNIARAVARIPLAETTSRIFMAAYLKTDFVQRYFTNELRTVSQPTLNIKQLSETLVVLPPIELQREFARRVLAVEKLKSAQRASLAEMDALVASLQHRAFRGEL
ncbi:MAG: restriction endonuclease subunit S [Candidatus Binatia bacterium]